MATPAPFAPPVGTMPAASQPVFFRGALRPSTVLMIGRSARRRARRPTSGSPPYGAGPAGRPSRQLVRWLNRRRRLAVALLLCVAAGLTVQQLTPAPADTVPAYAAAR